jgi:hypothetical protein
LNIFLIFFVFSYFFYGNPKMSNNKAWLMFPQDLLLRFYVSFTIFFSLSHVNGSFPSFLFFLSFFFLRTHARAHTHTHTHTHIYIYIYIYINFLPNSLYILNSKFLFPEIKFLDPGICLYKCFTRVNSNFI